MNANATIPTPRNENIGFFMRMGRHANEAWPLAMTAIERLADEEFEAVRTLLESDHGRFFAGAVLDRMLKGAPLAKAIEAEAAKWAKRRTDRFQKRAFGIPVGLPYLEALVIHYSALEHAC